jgi:hypothetical protein
VPGVQRLLLSCDGENAKNLPRKVGDPIYSASPERREFARLLLLGSRPVREGPGSRLGALPELSSALHATCATYATLSYSDRPAPEKGHPE